MIIGLGAIAKNEGPYLLEWIAWHRLMGIDRIIMYDNGSTDGSTELLAALDRAGVVTHVPFPDPKRRRPQCPAYEDLFRRVRGQVDWLAVFDLDEFLMPTGDLNLRQILMRQPDTSGGVVVNWALFGSNGITKFDNRPVTERFVRRAEQSFGVNRHIKAIVRVRDLEVGARIPNPHSFSLLSGKQYTRADGLPAGVVPSGEQGLSHQVSWAGLRLNHYAVKSRAEFFEIKRPRGDAMNHQGRLASYFENHDENDVLDTSALDHIPGCKEEMALVLRAAKERGGLDPDWCWTLPVDAQTVSHGVLGVYWCAREQCFVVDGWRENAAVDPLPAITLDCPDANLVGPHTRALHYRRVWSGDHVDSADALSGVRLYFKKAPRPRPGPVSVYSHETLLATLNPIELDSEADLPPLPNEAPVSPAAGH